MSRYSLFEAIAPLWHAPLVRLGMPEDPTAGQVAVWQASRRAYHQRYAVPVEAVGLRAAGHPTASNSAELGLTRSAVRPAALDLAALRMMTPFLADVPAWRTGRDDGHPDSQIAQLYDTPEHLVRIALDGWPPTHPTPGSIERDALRLWRNGAELGDIATSVGVSADTLRQWLREGSLRLSPTRITAIEVTQRFGGSPSLNRKYRLDGVLPEPDGGSRTRPWWWADTIAHVARTSLRHRCSQCGARMASAKGRAMHESSRHT